MCGSPRHKFCTASLDNALLIDGFVFAPPDRSILIQPSEVTRFASIPNWLCLATFSVPGPPQRERPDAPVPSARCCCLLRSHPSSPRNRHPPGLRHLASAIRHLPLATRHPPLFRRHPLDTRCSVSGSACPIPPPAFMTATQVHLAQANHHGALATCHPPYRTPSSATRNRVHFACMIPYEMLRFPGFLKISAGLVFVASQSSATTCIHVSLDSGGQRS